MAIIIPSIHTYDRKHNAMPNNNLTEIVVTEKTSSAKFEQNSGVYAQEVLVEQTDPPYQESNNPNIDHHYSGAFGTTATGDPAYVRTFVYLDVKTRTELYKFHISAKQGNTAIKTIPYSNEYTGEYSDVSFECFGTFKRGKLLAFVDLDLESATLKKVDETYDEEETREDTELSLPDENEYILTETFATEGSDMHSTSTVDARSLYGYEFSCFEGRDDSGKYFDVYISAPVYIKISKASFKNPFINNSGWEQNEYDDVQYDAPVDGTFEEYTIDRINFTIHGNRYSLSVQDNAVNYGENSNNSFSVDGNELMQSGISAGYARTLEHYKNGKETATILCDLGEYMTDDGELAVSTKYSDYPMLFQKYQIVRPMVRNADGTDRPLSSYKDGTPKDFMVLSTRLVYDGEIMQEIVCQEYCNL
jgi:hypothetical protein